MRGKKCPPVRRRIAMMQYLLSVHSVEGEVREPMSAESVTQVGILEEEL